MSDRYEILSEASVEMTLDVTFEAEVVVELEGIFLLELEEAGVEVPEELEVLPFWEEEKESLAGMKVYIGKNV